MTSIANTLAGAAADFMPEALSLSALAALFGTGLSQAARLIELETAQGSGLPDSLVVDRFWGTEGVNTLFRFEVDCLSVSTNLDLTAFLGEEITLRLLLPSGGKRSWHGYCLQATWLGADGGLARYRLTLEPFLAMLARRTDAYIFQDQDALGICEALLADYPQAHVRYEVTQPLMIRPICTQYQESDLAFLTRLLAEEGLSWRFEHEQDEAAVSSANSPRASGSSNSAESSSTAHARHCLVIFDAAASLAQWPRLSPDLIRFHHNHATEAEDGITTLAARRQAGANAVALSSWDAAQLVAPSAEEASALDAGALPTMQVYDGAGQQRYPDQSAASRLAALRLQALELPHKVWTGTGSARQIAAGSTFTLSGHTHYTGDQAQFKVLHVTHAAANNLPAQVAQLLQSQVPMGSAFGAGFMPESADGAINTGASSYQFSSDYGDGVGDGDDGFASVERGTYRNRLACVRAAVPVVPLACAAACPLTATGPQTAIVVGVAGQMLSVERNHQVRVQFAWQRGANPLAGGLSELNSPDPTAADETGHAPGDETSGTWVRVAESLAGPNWGTQFAPRIGTEVLIDFLDGDIDRPVIVGQLYNGQDRPPFAAGVDSGVNHAGVISGWHSANHSKGYNQWMLEVAVHKGFETLDVVPHKLVGIEILAPAKVHVVHPANVPNKRWLMSGSISGAQQKFGAELLGRHPFVLMPSAVSTPSWNLVIDVAFAKGLFKLFSDEDFAIDTRLNPPSA